MIDVKIAKMHAFRANWHQSQRAEQKILRRKDVLNQFLAFFIRMDAVQTHARTNIFLFQKCITYINERQIVC